MTTMQADVNTGYAATEGDTIYYEVRGHGPPLLMISGGGGDAGFFSLVAPMLSDEYKVITYDRLSYFDMAEEWSATLRGVLHHAV